jgi:hypothetical protein
MRNEILESGARRLPAKKLFNAVQNEQQRGYSKNRRNGWAKNGSRFWSAFIALL